MNLQRVPVWETVPFNTFLKVPFQLWWTCDAVLVSGKLHSA